MPLHRTLKPLFILAVAALLTLPIFPAHDDTYAGPPAWSGKKPTALPPGLQNHSLPAQAWSNGLRRFSATVEIVNAPAQPEPPGQSAIKDDIITYYHTDHLSTPMFLTDEVGSIVWRREQTPFGETSFERGSVTENLRFPGQYFDAESCLHYNFYRDTYFPKLGRYGQPDPIGQYGLNAGPSGDRLVSVKDAATQQVKGSYTYDGLGRRASKTAGGATTYFIYDTGGRIIAEYDGSGGWVNSRAYMDGEPLARFDAGTQDPPNPSLSPYYTVSGTTPNVSACLTWEPVAGASYYVVFWGAHSGYYPNSSPQVAGANYCVQLYNGGMWYFVVRAYDSGNNLIGESDEVSALHWPGSQTLSHYSYDYSLGGEADCGICHISAGTFTRGFALRSSSSACTTCHNATGTGHDRPYRASHPVYVNVTTGGMTKYPTYTNITGGEYGDTLHTRLVGGKVSCATCHNAMQKTGIPWRGWELCGTADHVHYALQRSGWAYYGFLKPVVYRDTTLWSQDGPTYLKDRKPLVVSESEYTLDPVTGTITFHQAQPAGTYIYVTLWDDYLRNANTENRFCGDCHGTATHKWADCTVCHGTHNTGNLYGVRERLGTPGGYSDVVYTDVSGLSGPGGVCVVCHTKTMYGNATSIAPEPHYDGQDCTACHPHDSGFPSFTTTLRELVHRLFAWLGADTAFASPPAWSGKKPTALPPGLANHSLNANAVAHGLKRFRATVTISNEPVAQTQSGQPAIKDDIIMYYHNDHLGTPLFLTDEVGSIVWRREQKPFGETTYLRGGVTENLRFPGQYWDEEKNSSYNFYRDSYVPSIGRYGQADPIGREGGINLYSYADNEPVSSNDPYGLCKWTGVITMKTYSGKKGPAVGIVIMALQSECCNNKQSQGIYTAYCGGASAAPKITLPVQVATAVYEFEGPDTPSDSDPKGLFSYLGGSANFYSYSRLRTGSLVSTGGTWQAGIDIGIDAFLGFTIGTGKTTTCCKK